MISAAKPIRSSWTRSLSIINWLWLLLPHIFLVQTWTRIWEHLWIADEDEQQEHDNSPRCPKYLDPRWRVYYIWYRTCSNHAVSRLEMDAIYSYRWTMVLAVMSFSSHQLSYCLWLFFNLRDSVSRGFERATIWQSNYRYILGVKILKLRPGCIVICHWLEILFWLRPVYTGDFWGHFRCDFCSDFAGLQ